MSQDESKSLPAIVECATFDEQLKVLRARVRAHTREGDAIAAAARRAGGAGIRHAGPWAQRALREEDAMQRCSPALNQAGEVVAVAFATQTSTNDALFIPASHLRNLLSGNDPTTAAPGCD